MTTHRLRNRMVAVGTLIGRVSSGAIKGDSERIAHGTQGVTDVQLELLVGEMKNWV